MQLRSKVTLSQNSAPSYLLRTCAANQPSTNCRVSLLAITAPTPLPLSSAPASQDTNNSGLPLDYGAQLASARRSGDDRKPMKEKTSPLFLLYHDLDKNQQLPLSDATLNTLLIFSSPAPALLEIIYSLSSPFSRAPNCDIVFNRNHALTLRYGFETASAAAFLQIIVESTRSRHSARKHLSVTIRHADVTTSPLSPRASRSLHVSSRLHSIRREKKGER